MIQTVVKRDGRIVGFNEQKIMAAIRKAMLHTEQGEDDRLLYLATSAAWPVRPRRARYSSTS